MKKIRVMLVDDHPMLRAGLDATLRAEDDMECVGEAQSGEEAVAVYAKLRPDVVLMDLRLGQMSGVTAIEEIRKLDAEATARWLRATLG